MSAKCKLFHSGSNVIKVFLKLQQRIGQSGYQITNGQSWGRIFIYIYVLNICQVLFMTDVMENTYTNIV